ncbi:hypothetical protein LZ32DRAFT_257809 [Colletotrichum eremochloae]|nr:hypothetical protein LZ32DRAFT_257809 [Colletotrichum eremochloae]
MPLHTLRGTVIKSTWRHIRAALRDVIQTVPVEVAQVHNDSKHPSCPRPPRPGTLASRHYFEPAMDVQQQLRLQLTPSRRQSLTPPCSATGGVPEARGEGSSRTLLAQPKVSKTILSKPCNLTDTPAEGCFFVLVQALVVGFHYGRRRASTLSSACQYNNPSSDLRKSMRNCVKLTADGIVELDATGCERLGARVMGHPS